MRYNIQTTAVEDASFIKVRKSPCECVTLDEKPKKKEKRNINNIVRQAKPIASHVIH